MKSIRKIINQVLCFVLVSGIGWIIDFSIYICLANFSKLDVGIANLLSSIPAITFVFFISTRKIFKNKNSKMSITIKYLIYFIYQLILVSSVSLLAHILYGIISEGIFNSNEFLMYNLKFVIKVIITPITMIINFIVMKLLSEKL